MDRIIISYGCGEDGKKFITRCGEEDIVLEYVCDGNTKLEGTIFCNQPVRSIDCLKNDNRDKIIIISSRRYYYEIYELLKEIENSIVLPIDQFFYLYESDLIDSITYYDETEDDCYFFSELDNYIEKNRKICLFADAVLLEVDKNAGAKASFCYLKVLIKNGWNVVYYSSLADYSKKDAERLEQLGCFVLWGYNRKSQILNYLVNNKDDIELNFINRPEVFEDLRNYLATSQAPIIYYGHDIHFLRLQREYEILGDKKLLAESEQIKKIELNCIKMAELAGYPSIYEVDFLKRELPQSNIRYLPLYSYEDRELITYSDDRSGIMFIGGFVHRPNVDAMKWFCKEILPEIRRNGVNDVFYIIGSNPNEEIHRLSADGIEVVGYVSDKELEAFYRKCRLAVIPLRYGAGMKGKLLEAMYNGMPVVTTSIGVEGLIDYEECIEVEDDAVKFAKTVTWVIKDVEYAKQLSQKAQEYIRENFNEVKFESCLDGYI